MIRIGLIGVATLLALGAVGCRAGASCPQLPAPPAMCGSMLLAESEIDRRSGDFMFRAPSLTLDSGELSLRRGLRQTVLPIDEAHSVLRLWGAACSGEACKLGLTGFFMVGSHILAGGVRTGDSLSISEPLIGCFDGDGTLFFDRGALKLTFVGVPGRRSLALRNECPGIASLSLPTRELRLATRLVGENWWVSGTLDLHATITNLSPVAVASAPSSVPCSSSAGATVRLDGSKSHDLDGDELSFFWLKKAEGPVRLHLDGPPARTPEDYQWVAKRAGELRAFSPEAFDLGESAGSNLDLIARRAVVEVMSPPGTAVYTLRVFDTAGAFSEATVSVSVVGCPSARARAKVGAPPDMSEINGLSSLRRIAQDGE